MNLKPILCAAVMICAVQARASAEDAFEQKVLPFLKTYCVNCHNAETTEGALDLMQFKSAAALSQNFRQWEHVLTFVRKEEMPPEKAKQPSREERAAVLDVIEELLAADARKHAGDPGVVLPRRLTVAEYNYTIRDLTGVDIRPADSFPVDPASGEGFSNTGEALVMSPNLFKKYYAAAQLVADHVVLTPSGMRFAPYPVVTFADQVKYHEQAILRFYEEHQFQYETYLMAAWSYRHRPPARAAATIEEWAAEQKVSPRYLRKIWETLDGPVDPFFLGKARQQWLALPAPKDAATPVSPSEIRDTVHDLADTIRRASRVLCPPEGEAIIAHAGNGPVDHIARRTKTAQERNSFFESYPLDSRRFQIELHGLPERTEVKIVLQAAHFAEGSGAGFVVLKNLNFSTKWLGDYRSDDKENNLPLRDLLQQHAPEQWEQLRPGQHPLGQAIDANSIVVSTSAPLEINVPVKAFGDRKELRFFVDATFDREQVPQHALRFAVSERPVASIGPEGLLIDSTSELGGQFKASCAEFCQTFPNRFVSVDETRGLSAGFHLIEGVFRDDVPLYKLVLSDEEQRELDRLWAELYFGTGMMEKMLRGFVFFERSERNFLKHPDFDPFKEEDPELVKDDTLARFEQVYLVRSGVKVGDPNLASHPVTQFFGEIRHGLKQRRQQFAEAKPIYLRQLLEFAERAYRRPLIAEERARLERFYETVCQQPELGIEQAVRGVITSILLSPYFCCRIDVPSEGESVQPLSDIALASRLSYFLWASMPDAELLAVAKAGKLNDEEMLRQQTRRMLQDPKVSGFALEFFGQWLRYRDFITQDSVDRTVFPTFNDELRLAMFEEPTRLVTHLAQNNLPVTDLLYGDTTFVNKPLAAHYGWPYQDGGSEWQQVDGIQHHGRGGVLGMAVFLTANSQPQRTSPVKRGFWVVHQILGEHIPAPPNEIPPLPEKETETDGQTVRQLLALHTQAETCARCHRRFDPVGLSMEGFDPIGRSRTLDLAGRPVDNVVKLPDGAEARGVPEYLKSLQAERNDDFIKTLNHKFLGYALGRSVELSDYDLLQQMHANLERDSYRIGTLFETVICSPQFRMQRGRDFANSALK